MVVESNRRTKKPFFLSSSVLIFICSVPLAALLQRLLDVDKNQICRKQLAWWMIYPPDTEAGDFFYGFACNSSVNG